jgi:hypothetical protein
MRQKIAEIINVIFGFRKFLLMLLVFVIGVVFRLANLINGSEMVDLLKSTTLAFMGANGVEHIVTAAKDYMSSKSQGDDPKTSYEDLVSPAAQEAEDLEEESKGK